MAAGRSGDLIWMRPEHAGVGRPAQRSRTEITAAAITIADRDGLDAVSMRRVAAELGTGAASLYRYVDTREDLLDLMTDATAAEYSLARRAETGWPISSASAGGTRDHAAAPVAGRPVATRGVLGPNGLILLEHVLDVLAPHPADQAAKLEAFAMLNAVTAMFVQNELAGGSARQQRNAPYLKHATASGEYPRLARLLTPPPAAAPADSVASAEGTAPVDSSAPAGGAAPVDRYGDIMSRILACLSQARLASHLDLAGDEDAERVPGRVGIDPQRLLGIAGAVEQLPGAELQRPPVLGIKVRHGPTVRSRCSCCGTGPAGQVASGSFATCWNAPRLLSDPRGPAAPASPGPPGSGWPAGAARSPAGS